jgi:phosphatidylglycerophosphate synthase
MLLDPLADKLMSVFAVIAFASTGVLPWIVLIVLLSKELLMVAGGIFLISETLWLPPTCSAKSRRLHSIRPWLLRFFISLWRRGMYISCILRGIFNCRSFAVCVFQYVQKSSGIKTNRGDHPVRANSLEHVK